MPLQHAADGMLRRMRRGHGGRGCAIWSSGCARTCPTWCSAPPSSSATRARRDAEFEELARLRALGRVRSRRRVPLLGRAERSLVASSEARCRVAYGSAAREEADERFSARSAGRRTARSIGRELEVLVEGPSEESELVMVGRHAGQAPEIDGAVYLSGGAAARARSAAYASRRPPTTTSSAKRSTMLRPEGGGHKRDRHRSSFGRATGGASPCAPSPESGPTWTRSANSAGIRRLGWRQRFDAEDGHRALFGAARVPEPKLGVELGPQREHVTAVASDPLESANLRDRVFDERGRVR